MRRGVRSDGQPESAEELEARLEELERRLERLRGAYESFFLGVERAPPNVQRREMNRLMMELQQISIGKATTRFRFQSLSQKWVQFTTYWNRTLREIEAGTYRRDIAKVQKRLAERGSALSEADAVALGIPAARAKALVDSQRTVHAAREARLVRTGEHPAAATTAERPALAGGPAPSAASGAPPGYTEQSWRSFYDRYVEAHRAVGAAPKYDYATMSARLGGEISRMIATKNYTRVDLDLEVDGGQVRLRAKPVR